MTSDQNKPEMRKADKYGTCIMPDGTAAAYSLTSSRAVKWFEYSPALSSSVKGSREAATSAQSPRMDAGLKAPWYSAAEGPAAPLVAKWAAAELNTTRSPGCAKTS